ncbi:class I SAM-dependent methyltransferase [Endozoicomonas sp. SM1973]|uniref:Class I SAM-dependent methyltransferase n=1 Tax=Spartinivicinus marinus TaxID=2994442 RepID=A0A853IBW7_9GAMM|nr:class I SAM-dependent methyltransferase [Spartinivicinus marinus]MCX4027021.1 methyltransferase domain-containing protein [Spartinivicinus marinus]NYZ67017.1 class I SAM-dependent methyltransferase [Spartinivicinus marinus]
MVVDFSGVAKEYHRLGINQQSAGVKLINQLNFGGDEKILDIGCGDARLTSVMASLTTGDVVGIDISPGMINTARKNLLNGFFIEGDIERLSLNLLSTFDIVFINSVIHWFKQPVATLKRIQQLMAKNSCLAIQTPLKGWCPLLQEVISQTIEAESLKETYKHYKSPWFHLASVSEYTQFFQNLGYRVNYADEDSLITELTSPLKLWDLFESGPAQAYFNPENFSRTISANLPIIFKDVFCTIAENLNETAAEYKRAFFKLQCNY